MYITVKSLMFYNILQWENQEREKELNSGHADAENVGRFWLAKSKKTPNEYYDTKDAAAHANETGSVWKKLEETQKTLPETLAYAGRFQTDEGMTGYLKRVLPTLPETDRRTVENLLKLSDQEIRAEIKRISA